MDRRENDQVRREGATVGFWFTPGNPVGTTLARSGRRRAFRRVSCLCDPRTRGIVMRPGTGNSATAGRRRFLIGESRWQGSPIERSSRARCDALGSSRASRGGSRFRIANAGRFISILPSADMGVGNET